MAHAEGDGRSDRGRLPQRRPAALFRQSSSAQVLRNGSRMTTARVLSLEQLEQIAGEECLTAMLAGFSCPPNEHVEKFIRHDAVQSERLGATVTYLALSDKDDILGFFTLVLKPFTVSSEGLSSRNRRLIERFSELDEDHGTYTAALYLIAHLGKNFALDSMRRISGAELLGLAFDVLRKARKLVGGKLVLIDRELDRPKLLDFYQANGFKSWNKRFSKKDAIEYDQMLCVLKD